MDLATSRISRHRTKINMEVMKACPSTARILNLTRAYQNHIGQSAYKNRPMFQSLILNRCVIVKHSLRSGELSLFHNYRMRATKIILPVTPSNAAPIERSFFIGQIGYPNILEQLLGGTGGAGAQDVALLNLIDALPTLDPFIARERLLRAGFEPDSCYFDSTTSDTIGHFRFAFNEINDIIGMDFGARQDENRYWIFKLVQKILTTDNVLEIAPYRLGLDLDRKSFEDGVSCWRALIYYKWMLTQLAPQIPIVRNEIDSVVPVGVVTRDESSYVQIAKARLSNAMTAALRALKSSLRQYDDAYQELAQRGGPQALRQLLVSAQKLFSELSDLFAAVQHILSYWRYRFAVNTAYFITAEELMEILFDFEFSLNTTNDRAAIPLNDRLH